MTGPEHYQRAEYWADTAEQAKKNNSSDVAELVGLAQVHATLALAAATASPLVHKMCGDSSRTTDWGYAIGWDTAPEARATN
ncbi:hypothetical protein JOF56_011656 [Kibdelosporangium banguiense]|uniref:Uncharacterized protein n=1 Tax=Kibdelosporangium banguiense TaxID=1365924 RepID=A0ABS4U4Z7_9PSEU|nr:hypothetical protein [Kibdelosporangium banguiense]MBP2331271.1 hypothetical protein [Kibdelosporangium banguiense]